MGIIAPELAGRINEVYRWGYRAIDSVHNSSYESLRSRSHNR
jgi:hypothetical protein